MRFSLADGGHCVLAGGGDLTRPSLARGASRQLVNASLRHLNATPLCRRLAKSKSPNHSTRGHLHGAHETSQHPVHSSDADLPAQADAPARSGRGVRLGAQARRLHEPRFHRGAQRPGVDRHQGAARRRLRHPSPD